jgi:thiol-disulfide isomerase/thioredoxin
MRPVFVAVVLAAVVAIGSPAYAGELKVGDRVAERDGSVDANGKAFKVKPIKGWKMLTFGASWCKPCAKELPAGDKLAPAWKDKVTFVAVDRFRGQIDGQIIVFFVMTVAAAEAAVGLAIVIAMFRHKEVLTPDAFTSLKW